MHSPSHAELQHFITKNAFTSLSEAITFHEQSVQKNELLKGFFTNDQETLTTVQRMLDASNEKEFLTDLILTPPNLSTNEQGSRTIYFSPIEKFPQYIDEYNKLQNETSLVTIGGPAAFDTSLIASLMKTINLSQNIHISGPFKESNLAHSALQLHVRHGTALNAEADLTGHALLVPFIIRNTMGTSLEEILKPDFLKIDIKFSSITMKQFRIYLGNELNWVRQMIRHRLGLVTEHDVNRLESAFSQDVLHLLERVSEVEFSSNARLDPSDSISIHVDLSYASGEKTTHNNQLIKETAGIQSHELTKEEIEFFFGSQKDNIIQATRYPNDGCLLIDAQQKKRKLLLENGGRSLQKYVTHVLFTNKKCKEELRVAGVIMDDNQFIYASHVHISPGYKAQFRFDQVSISTDKSWRNILNLIENKLQLSLPVHRHCLTVATGVSVNALMHKTAHIQRIIEKYGTTPQFAVTNSHWTLLLKNDDYLLMRITGGGNTGLETYNPAYFLNLIANTARIFGHEALAGIVSTYGCSRSINARNSTEFFKAANVLISYGKGGTGNTKRHAEAILALQELGFHREIQSFLSGHVNYNGEKLLSIAEFIRFNNRKMKFLTEDEAHFARRLSYIHTLSNTEMCIVVSCFSIVISLIFGWI